MQHVWEMINETRKDKITEWTAVFARQNKKPQWQHMTPTTNNKTLLTSEQEHGDFNISSRSSCQRVKANPTFTLVWSLAESSSFSPPDFLLTCPLWFLQQLCHDERTETSEPAASYNQEEVSMLVCDMFQKKVPAKVIWAGPQSFIVQHQFSCVSTQGSYSGWYKSMKHPKGFLNYDFRVTQCCFVSILCAPHQKSQRLFSKTSHQ